MPQLLFCNRDEGRLRTGWRIALFLVLLVGINATLAISTRAALGSLPRDSLLVIVLLCGSAITATVIARRWLDRRPLRDLGLAVSGLAAADVTFGFCLSGLMAGAVFFALVGTGHVVDVRFALSGTELIALLGTPLLVAVLVGCWEELVFRGYLFQNLSEGLGRTIAIVVSCVLYGLIHAGNDAAGALSTGIIVAFGFLRLYGYLATGLLWLSAGMHIGWNYFQAVIFGFPASGHVESTTLLQHERAGATWLSGGDFGPEASVIVLPVVAAALLAMRWWATRSWRAASGH